MCLKLNSASRLGSSLVEYWDCPLGSITLTVSLHHACICESFAISICKCTDLYSAFKLMFQYLCLCGVYLVQYTCASIECIFPVLWNYTSIRHPDAKESEDILTHWGRDKMAAVSQTTLSNAFFMNENVRISIKISLKFVPKGPINNNPALV